MSHLARLLLTLVPISMVSLPDSGNATPWVMARLATTPAPADSIQVHPAQEDSAHGKGKGALITECGLHTALEGTRGVIDATYISFEAGYLARTGSRTLLGGDVSLTANEDGSFWAILARVRREVDRNLWVDVAAGPIVSATGDGHNLDGLGISAYTMVHYRGYIGAILGVHSLNYESPGGDAGVYGDSGYSGRVTTTYVGVRLGKGPGIIGAAVFGIIVGLAVTSLAATQ